MKKWAQRLTIEDLRKSETLIRGSFTFMLKPRQHYRHYVHIWSCMPSTLAQWRFFEREGVCPGELGLDDCERIAEVCAELGNIAYFRLTKSKRWARMESCMPDGFWRRYAEKYGIKE